MFFISCCFRQDNILSFLLPVFEASLLKYFCDGINFLAYKNTFYPLLAIFILSLFYVACSHARLALLLNQINIVLLIITTEMNFVVTLYTVWYELEFLLIRIKCHSLHFVVNQYVFKIQVPLFVFCFLRHAYFLYS